MTLNTNSALALARSAFREKVSCFDEGDPVVVENGFQQTRILYICVRASGGTSESTFVECRIDFDSRQMWIGALEVSTSFRLQGLGRQLAEAAEEIARQIGIGMVNVFPLPSAQAFWRKMGFRPHPRMARVLSREFSSSQPSPGGDEAAAV